MATPPGFEPGLTGPKPVVLPLHHGVAERFRTFENKPLLKITPFPENFHSGTGFFADFHRVPRPFHSRPARIACEYSAAGTRCGSTRLRRLSSAKASPSR